MPKARPWQGLSSVAAKEVGGWQHGLLWDVSNMGRLQLEQSGHRSQVIKKTDSYTRLPSSLDKGLEMEQMPHPGTGSLIQQFQPPSMLAQPLKGLFRA